MHLRFTLPLTALSLLAQPATAQNILTLDSTRTGDGAQGLGDFYLTSPAMSEATDLLLNEGFEIFTTGRFENPALDGMDVLFTGLVDVSYTASEIADIHAFVEAGGGLVIMRDWGPYYYQGDSLAFSFGVSYLDGPIGPSTPSPVLRSASHPIWSGPTGALSAFDQIFSNGIADGADIIGTHSVDGSGALGVLDVGEGRVVFLTDISAFVDAGESDLTVGSQSSRLWRNLFYFAAGDAIGSPFCTAAPNSQSADGAKISANGSTSLADEDLILRCSGVPAGPGLFVFAGTTTQAPFGNGFLCLGAPYSNMGIVVPNFGGGYRHDVDFAVHGAALASLGTVHFQCWYRDFPAGGSRFNASDGLTIVFQP